MIIYNRGLRIEHLGQGETLQPVTARRRLVPTRQAMKTVFRIQLRHEDEGVE